MRKISELYIEFCWWLEDTFESIRDFFMGKKQEEVSIWASYGDFYEFEPGEIEAVKKQQLEDAGWVFGDAEDFLTTEKLDANLEHYDKNRKAEKRLNLKHQGFSK